MESPLLLNIIYLFGNIFRVYLIYQFLKIFFVVAEDETHRIYFRFGLYFLFFILNSMGYLYYRWSSTIILLSNLIGVFLITLSYRGKWKYRLCATVTIVALCVICEDLIYKLMLKWKITQIVVIGVAISDLLLLMIILFLQKITDLRNGEEEISMLEWLGVVFVPIISIAISVITLDKCQDEIAVTIGGIGLLVLNVFFFCIFDHLTKMYRNQAQLIALDIQNHAYEKQLDILAQSEDRISALRHDMTNHILTLQYLSKQDDNKVLQKYLDEMNAFVHPEGRFVSTGVPLVDGILNLKLGEATTRVQAEIKCETQLQNSGKMDEIDISILLGNLLDNAIQAMEKCYPPNKVELLMEEKPGIVFVKIRNNYDGKIKGNNGSLITTKKDKANHGIGLRNVKRIVEKYHGEMKIDYDKQWFSVEILLFLKPIKD